MGAGQILDRFRFRLRRGSLDLRLANGTDPYVSPDLVRRARQLVSPSSRAGLAEAIRGAIAAADAPGGRRFSAAVPLQRADIRAERELLLGLAGELDGRDPVSPRGVARVSRLLTDGRSPLYAPSPRGALRAELRHLRMTLLMG
jgi:hypothetical protein